MITASTRTHALYSVYPAVKE